MKTITINLTLEEYAVIKHAADAAGMTIDAFVVKVVMSRTGKILES